MAAIQDLVLTFCSKTRCNFITKETENLDACVQWNQCIIVYSSNNLFHELSRNTLISLHQGLHIPLFMSENVVHGKCDYPNKTSYLIINKSHVELFSMQLPVKLSMTLLLLL